MSLRCMRVAVLLLAALGLHLAAAAAGTREPLKVFVVNYPLQYFAERIAGEHASVVFPAPPDVDPAFWMPDIDTVLAYQGADLILLNGAGYARWLKQVTLPRSRLVDTSKTFADRFIPVDAGPLHRHGPEGEHSHQDIATHTWLDFKQAGLQATAVADALVKARPEHENVFKENLSALLRDLDALDAALETFMAGRPGQPLLASHPVYQYVARRYGLNLQSLHWEPDQFPSDAEWAAFAERLQSHAAQWMLWEAPPDPRTRERLEALGVGSVVFDPLGNKPARGDFLSVMEENTAGLGAAY